MFIDQFNSENPHKRLKCVVCGDFAFDYYMIYKEILILSQYIISHRTCKVNVQNY